jgi:hypothetical protein
MLGRCYRLQCCSSVLGGRWWSVCNIETPPWFFFVSSSSCHHMNSLTWCLLRIWRAISVSCGIVLFEQLIFLCWYSPKMIHENRARQVCL